MEKKGTIAQPDAGGRPPLGSLPVLVYDHGFYPDNNKQTAFAIGDRSLHTQVLPELANSYDYHVAANGWALLVAPGPTPHTRLWEPRTGESVSLPPVEPKLPDKWECYLSDVPTAPSCIVLVIDTANPRFLYCRVGDSRWSAHEYDIGELDLPPGLGFEKPRTITIEHMAVAGGKFYFRETKDLGIIDFASATPVFSYLEHPRVAFPDESNCRKDYLVGSGEELYNVCIFLKISFTTTEVLTVHVYRIDLSGPTPTLFKLDDLGDRVFLLSNSNAQLLCTASKYGLKGNRVCFNLNVTRDLDGGQVYIYDLDDQSLEVLRPCQGMAELRACPFWVLPTDPTTDGTSAHTLLDTGYASHCASE